MRRFKEFFFYYIPYRFYRYYEDEPSRDFSTYIAIVALTSINLWSIYALVSVYLDFEMMLFEKRFYNKFVFLPLVSSPIFAFVYYYYKANQQKYQETFTRYDVENIGRDKIKNLQFWMIIVLSILLVISSATSPLWMK